MAVCCCGDSQAKRILLAMTRYLKLLVLMCWICPLVLPQTWHESRSARVTVFSEDSDKTTKVLRTAALLDALLDRESAESALPLTILIVDQRTLSRFDNTGRMASLFVNTNDRMYILLGPRAQGPEITHEYVHYLSTAHAWRTEPWFHEGLAVALSALRERKGAVEIGARNRYDGLGCAANLPLDQLLNEEDFHGGSLARSRDLYRTAGRLLNFLLARKSLWGTLEQAQAAKGATTSKELADFLGIPGTRLHSEFAAYCGTTVSIPIAVPSLSAAEQPASPQRVEQELAGIMVRSQVLVAEGQRFFYDLLQHEPHNLEGRANLAIALTTSGRYDLALREFARLPKSPGAGWSSYRDVACQHVEGCEPSIEDEETAPLERRSTLLNDKSSVWGCASGCDWRSAASAKVVLKDRR